MEQNNGTAPQGQQIVMVTTDDSHIVTSYGVVSRQYVESLIKNSESLESKPKKSRGKRIISWFMGIVGCLSFLFICGCLCFSVFDYTTGNTSGGSFSYDDGFFYTPDDSDDEDKKDDDDSNEPSSDSDIPSISPKTSNAGLGVIVSELDSSTAQLYGISGGLVILGITENSSFIGTDVKDYDIITGAEGAEITSTSSLSVLLNKHDIGDEFTLTITRFSDGYAESFEVTVNLIDKTA